MPGRQDGFAALSYRGKAVAHFHNDKEIDIRLTHLVIEREGLNHLKDSTVHPSRQKRSQWIEIRFATAKEVDEIVRLMRIAIAQL